MKQLTADKSVKFGDTIIREVNGALVAVVKEKFDTTLVSRISPAYLNSNPEVEQKRFTGETVQEIVEQIQQHINS